MSKRMDISTIDGVAFKDQTNTSINLKDELQSQFSATNDIARGAQRIYNLTSETLISITWLNMQLVVVSVIINKEPAKNL